MRNLYILILLLTSQRCFSQAWTKKKGSGYQQIGFSYLTNNSIYNRDGAETQLNRAVSDVTISEYIEYGLTDKITLSASIPFKLESTSDEIYGVTKLTLKTSDE